jgi:ribonuclease R
MAQKNKKEQASKNKEVTQPSYEALVLDLLKNSPSRAYTLSKLYKDFKGKFSQEAIRKAVLGLAEKGAIGQAHNGRFNISANPVYVVGRVDYVNPGYAYIVPEDNQETEDIWVKQEDLLNALDKDKVKVMITQQKEYKKHPVGKVVEILERAQNRWVGRVEQNGQTTFVVVESKRMHYDIYVSSKDLQGAKHNDKVLVELTAGPTAYKNPVGKIIQVFGPMGEHEVEMHAIMAEFNLPHTFPEEVSRQADGILTELPPSEIARRRDFRSALTLTIDPDTAKDFDDALSLQVLPSGNYEIGIHIADVSYYVPEDSIIDQEAFQRGTSVYLIDRTIPMLPDKLSNDLCSLKPHEDRPAFSAVFEMDAQGKLYHEWFGETVIHSNKRFTYEEAQGAIEDPQKSYHQELNILNQVAKQLRADRFKKGAINFETTEVRFQLDENGKPLSILPKINQDTHRLIEEFMLLANRRVALHVHRMKKAKPFPTFVYRTHDKPDLEKMGDFALFVKQFGYSIEPETGRIAQSINTLTARAAGKPEAHIIQTLAVRMMAKALYTTEPKPHFGLAFEHYTHFTSPIRRYPDLMVHRMLKKYLKGSFNFDQTAYEKKCRYASEREKVAADAERASIKYKQVELMQALQGEVLQGVISSMMDWGIYVELVDNLCEGMIRLADMTDDYYQLDEKRFKLVGQRTKKTYQLGELIKVRVKACDVSKRTIDLLLADE